MFCRLHTQQHWICGNKLRKLPTQLLWLSKRQSALARLLMSLTFWLPAVRVLQRADYLLQSRHMVGFGRLLDGCSMAERLSAAAPARDRAAALASTLARIAPIACLATTVHPAHVRLLTTIDPSRCADNLIVARQRAR